MDYSVDLDELKILYLSFNAKIWSNGIVSLLCSELHCQQSEIVVIKRKILNPKLWGAIRYAPRIIRQPLNYLSWPIAWVS